MEPFKNEIPMFKSIQLDMILNQANQDQIWKCGR
jgi:hypothetical protein